MYGIYLLKYVNGNVASGTQIWTDYSNSSYNQNIEYLGKDIDLFFNKEVDKSWSTPEWNRYFIKPDGSTFYLDSRIGSLQQIDIVETTKNYIVITLSVNEDSGYDSKISSGKGISLISIADGKMKFTDHYCGIGGDNPAHVRFDESTNMFYIGSDSNSNYEFIYTII
jgi:hypothetical protein